MNPRDQVVPRRGDPDGACTDDRHEGAAGKLDLAVNSVESAVDPHERSLAVGDQPNGPLPRRDATFAIADGGRDMRLDPIKSRVHAVNAIILAAGRPDGVEADGETRAWPAAHGDDLRNIVLGRVDPRQAVVAGV